MADKEIEIVIKAKDEASGVLRSVGGAFAELEGSSKSFLTQALEPVNKALEIGIKALTGFVAAGGVGAAAFLTDAVKNSADFEQAIADIDAISGSTNEELQQMSDLARSLGLRKDLKVETLEATDAIEMLLRNGIDIQDVLGGAAEGVILLANATGTDGFAEAADVATDAIKLFNKDASEMVGVADQISGVVNNSKFDLIDYDYALTNSGGVANLMGISFEELNAVLAATSQNYRTGREAGTNLKVMMGFLIPKSNETADAMKSLGIITGYTQNQVDDAKLEFAALETKIAALDPTSADYAERLAELQEEQKALTREMTKGENLFFNQDGSMKSLSEIAQILQDKMGHLSDEEQGYYMRKIFGNEAWKSGIELMRLGSAGVEDWKRKIGDVSAEENAAARMDTLKSQWEILQDIYTEFSRQIGDSASGPLKDFVKWMIEVAENVGPTLVSWLQTFITTGLVPMLTMFKEWIGDGTWILTWLSDTWAKLILFKDALVEAATNIWAFIKPIIDNISQFITWKDILMGLGVMIGMTLVANIASLIAALGPFLVLLGTLAGAFSLIKTAWETDWMGINTIVTGAMGAMGISSGTLMHTLKTNFGLALEDVKAWASGQDTEWSGVKTLWGNIQIFFGEVWARVKEKLEEWTGYQKLMEWFATAKEKWNEFKEAVSKIQQTWEEVKPVLTGLVEGLKKVSDWIVENKELLASVGTAFVTWRVGAAALAGAQGIMGLLAALGLLNPVVLALAAAVGAVVIAYNNDWLPLSPEVKQSIETIKGAFSDLWKNITENAPGALQEIVDFAKGTETDFQHSKEILNGLKEFFGTIWGEIASISQTAWDGIKEAFFGFVDPIVEWFEKTFPETSKAFTEGWGDLKQDLEELWTEIKDAWDLWTKNMKIVWDTFALAIEVAVKLLWAFIEGWWKEHGDAVTTLFDNTMAALALIFSTGAEVITSALTAFIALMTGDWDTFTKELGDIWTAIWELIKETARLAWENIKTVFNESFGGIISTATTKAQELWAAITAPFSLDAITNFFSGVGTNIVNAIGTGITNAKDGLMGIVTGMMGEVNAIPVAEADIQSPSKVWQDYGLMLGQGLEAGTVESVEKAAGATRTAMKQINAAVAETSDRVPIQFREMWGQTGDINQANVETLRHFFANTFDALGNDWRMFFENLLALITDAWEAVLQRSMNALHKFRSEFGMGLKMEISLAIQDLDNLLNRFNTLGQAVQATSTSIIQNRQVYNEFAVNVQTAGASASELVSQLERYKMMASLE